jgi:aspartyl-tRNA(Asn)/glutamyl-tRNA(Gln) amidotransferase subunit A
MTTILQAARALRSRERSSVELLEETTARADAHDRALGVYISRFDDSARAAAAQADDELAAGVDRGPLHGIPLGVKDIVATADGETTAQSRAFDPAWSDDGDAPAVARLRAAGAVVTGTLSTMELAIGVPDADCGFPLPRNPWNTRAWAGGSSSGAAAGVAAGLFLGALGSDTGGSIRVPAAFCGVSGLKPTYGRVPADGVVPLAWTLDHLGPLARSAWDCGALLEALTGAATAASASTRWVGGAADGRGAVGGDGFLAEAGRSLCGVRIGIERAHHLGRDGEDRALAPTFEQAVRVLRDLGATVVEVEIPRYDEVFAAYWVTMTSEALAAHGERLRARWDDHLRSTRTTIAAGALVSGADYVQAQRMRRAAQRDVAAVLRDVDLVAMPTANQGAPDVAELRDGPPMAVFRRTFTPYWDVVGNPVLALPIGFASNGLPLSMQLAARPWEEALLVRAGDAFQRATEWHLAEPGLGEGPVGHAVNSHVVDKPSALVDALLAAARLAPDAADRAAIAARYATVRPAVDALHASAAAGREPHGLRFDADPLAPPGASFIEPPSNPRGDRDS